MSPGAALVCEGVTKTFESVQALSDVTVTISAPATGLLGANGAGKSTLMKVALGLLAPDAGTVRVLGIDAATDRAAVRRRVGYMPEHDCLPTDMSAQDLCVHIAQLRGLSRRDARRRASEVLFAVGLEEERRRSIDTYSLGMRQRTKLAQALVHGPDLVVLDEPTSGLDPAGRREMLAIVRRLSRELGMAVLVSSHLLDDVESTCDEVVVLSSGRLAAQQPVESGPRTGPVALRVTGDVGAFAGALNARGVPTWPTREGDIGITYADDRVLALVRDTAAELGVGLLRLVDEGDQLEDAVVAAMGEHAPAPEVRA
ncbi:ABC-2 type transport system ATP-binding protein [Motilibacter rhizosphaerae]|uniref:ABC-2 type transport system ATP-binding protein n=1 Tax=Motilibacter rhizosphaerae TaxID=598652 RepID=A0A4Q7NTM2_9ACTN|nr:ABC transporter ATP-binding protein [Motilibacter rhizosphaerae]RZS90240.1 ABC-2 type transport system ATP-binding protein [Motilibacter rhizosphaerae]